MPRNKLIISIFLYSQIALSHAGLDLLTQKAYLDPFLTDQLFQSLHLVWDGKDKIKSQKHPKLIKQIAYARYGFHEQPNNNLPMGFTRRPDKSWAMNCLLCHGGSVNGKSIAGLGNTRLDMQTLIEDIQKLTRQNKNNQKSDNYFTNSKGTTNAFIFSADLLKKRDINLDLIKNKSDYKNLGNLKNHDLDALPWWNVRHKKYLYSDAFVEKHPRALMQLVMADGNTGHDIRGWESDYSHVLSFIESLKPPVYPQKINLSKARKGHKIYSEKCQKCHGNKTDYKNKVININKIKTDSARLFGLTKEFRQYYSQSWFGNYGKIKVKTEPKGYVAPPLDGIWASAPYLHNGSVPTLYHILNPKERPSYWRVKNYKAYDFEKIGQEIESSETLPENYSKLTKSEQREYFNTKLYSKSNAGHEFGSDLSQENKKNLIEYLKTL